MPLIRASLLIYTCYCIILLPFWWWLSVFFIYYSKFSFSSLPRLSIFDPLCHCFLIHFTFLSTSLPPLRFGLIPHSECSLKHVGKVSRVLEFNLWLCCCVISRKICTFFPLFFSSVFHLVKAKWAVSCISHCILCELSACTGVWLLTPERQPRHAIVLFFKHDKNKCFYRV